MSLITFHFSLIPKIVVHHFEIGCNLISAFSVNFLQKRFVFNLRGGLSLVTKS